MKKLLALGAASILLAGCSSSNTALAPTPSPDTAYQDETTDITAATPTDTMMTPEDSMMPTGSPTTMMMGTKMPDGSLQVKLDEQNTSGQTGTATFTESTDGKKVTVVLALAGGTFTAAQPAHIHVGSCPTPGAVKYPLTSVVNGKSTTTLAMSMADLLKSSDKLSVNIHKSAADSTVYTACGNIQ